MTTMAPGGGAGGCLAHHMNEPCAPFVDTLFQESGVELEMAEPFANSREEIASLAVLDGGEPGEIGPLPYWVPSPKLAVGTGETDAGPPSPSRLTLTEPHLPQAVQVVKIEDEVEDEEVAIIADPSDAAAVSTSRSSQAAADGVARPMVGLGEAGPAPFLRKTYEMVSDPGTDPFVSWGSSRNSFVVLDQHEFSKQVLPRYFKHSNFASFIRQLNTYGFRKIDTDRWEFANKGFLEGKKHLLKNISRRRKLGNPMKTTSSDGTSDSPKAGKEAELEMFKKDQEALKAEILKLREEQENSQHEINQVAERIRYAECRLRQTLLFISKAAKSPNFVQHLIQKRRQRGEVETCESSKKSKSDSEATKCLLEAMDPKIQSPNVDCLRIGDDSVQMESQPNNAVPLDFETIQMCNPWPSPMSAGDFSVVQGQIPDQMAGASQPDLPPVFHEMSETLLGDNVVLGDGAGNVEVEEGLAMDDMVIYLELEGLIEQSCGWSEYPRELGEQAAGLTP